MVENQLRPLQRVEPISAFCESFCYLSCNVFSPSVYIAVANFLRNLSHNSVARQVAQNIHSITAPLSSSEREA